MEIIDKGEEPNADLAQIAFADTREEAALMRGLLREAGIRSLARQVSLQGSNLGGGLLSTSPRRIYVRPDDAAAARRLLAETMVEEPPEEEVPEPANARYLAEAGFRGPDEPSGGRARDYSILGAYARFYLVAFIAFALALAVFLALR